MIFYGWTRLKAEGLTGIDILTDMIKFVCYLYLVCHEKPELMLRVRFTTSSCVESSAGKSFGTMPIATPL